MSESKQKRGTPGLVMYDDAIARTFEPFALTRPIASMVAGTAQIQERWSAALQLPCAGSISSPHLADFDESPGMASGTLPAGTVVANSRFAPAVEMLSHGELHVAEPSRPPATGSAWTCDGRVAAVRLARPMSVADFADGTLTLDALVDGGAEPTPLSGHWHEEIWDFIRHLPTTITDDILRFHSLLLQRHDLASRWRGAHDAKIIGEHPVLVAGATPGKSNDRIETATVEPYVVFDASAGPIFVEPGVHIHSFARIIGPCRIGRNTVIMGGDISGCSIGPVCKIRGEISSSIVLGYSNKGHEGFVGHSILGRWVNLGAGTTTSNLKNTYGSVALWTSRGVRETGLQFLGTMFGDHVKTGIGTMLTTGTVLGAAANVYGTAMPPKAVAPFSWGEGEPYATYRLDKFLETTATVMARRKITLSDRTKRQLSASFEKRWSVETPATSSRGTSR